MSILEICEWIQNTPSTAIRESLWVFPIIEGSHVLALGLSVGTVLWFDLRLMSLAMRHHTVSEAFEYVRNWMMLGFTIMFITGGLLFWSLAERCYVSGYFLLKRILSHGPGLMWRSITSQLTGHVTNGVRDLFRPCRHELRVSFRSGVIAAGRIMAYTF